jgi:hypothetical protein
MKIDEIEMVGDLEFPYSEAEKRLAVSSPRGSFEQFILYYAEQGNVRTLILVDDEKKIAAIATFVTHINGKVWQAKNVASYSPYKGLQLAGKLYKHVKEKFVKSIQSDNEQSWAGRVLWTKTLPALGMKPMVFDTKTERIIDPAVTRVDMYPEDESDPSLYRYMWILERHDHYPSQNLMNEDSLLMPYTGLWYNPNKGKPC